MPSDGSSLTPPPLFPHRLVTLSYNEVLKASLQPVQSNLEMEFQLRKEWEATDIETFRHLSKVAMSPFGRLPDEAIYLAIPTLPLLLLLSMGTEQHILTLLVAIIIDSYLVMAVVLVRRINVFIQLLILSNDNLRRYHSQHEDRSIASLVKKLS